MGHEEVSNSTIVSRIAEWATETHYAELPREVVEQAKNQVLNMIAAMHAGHFSEVGRTVSRIVKAWGAAKEATLIPSGERLSTARSSATQRSAWPSNTMTTFSLPTRGIQRLWSLCAGGEDRHQR